MNERHAKMARAPFPHGVREGYRGRNARDTDAAIKRLAARHNRDLPNRVTVRYLPPEDRKDPALFRLRKAKSCSVCKDRFHPRNSRDKVCEDCRAAATRMR